MVDKKEAEDCAAFYTLCSIIQAMRVYVGLYVCIPIYAYILIHIYICMYFIKLLNLLYIKN